MGESISIQEKRTLVSMASTILSYGLFFIIAIPKYQEGIFSTEEELQFWGTAILWLIPIQIVFKILTYILFYIVNYIITRSKDNYLTDEFDRMIESRGNRNYYYVFTAGFFLGMISLALAWPLLITFMIIIGSMALGSLFMDVSQFYFYRKGIL